VKTTSLVATHPHHNMAAAHTLYIAKVCPYAHRSYLVAHELGVICKEVTVEDVGLPTPAWYNKEVNPREMVPAIKLPNGTVARSCM
jgi:glutathione S-transferase